MAIVYATSIAWSKVKVGVLRLIQQPAHLHGVGLSSNTLLFSEWKIIKLGQ